MRSPSASWRSIRRSDARSPVRCLRITGDSCSCCATCASTLASSRQDLVSLHLESATGARVESIEARVGRPSHEWGPKAAVRNPAAGRFPKTAKPARSVSSRTSLCNAWGGQRRLASPRRRPLAPLGGNPGGRSCRVRRNGHWLAERGGARTAPQSRPSSAFNCWSQFVTR